MIKIILRCIKKVSNSSTIEVTYTGGDTCTGLSGQPERSTQINLICSNDVVPVTSVVSEGSCIYTLQSSF